MAMRYSRKFSVAKSKALARKGTSMTSVVASSESAAAPQSQGFPCFMRKIEPCRERMLKEWKISHMESVRKAMEVPRSAAL